MNENSNQVEVNAAFKDEMKEAQADGLFTQKRAAAAALAATSKLHKDDGGYSDLATERKDILTAMYYPTNEVQMRVIEATLKSAGVTLDETTRALLRALLNPAGVEEKLKQMKKPERKTLRDFLAKYEHRTASRRLPRRGSQKQQ
jgi:hypothetical protein